ncbi:MAG: tetratricopeptide repeat protein [Candidatus Rifleibacteriota bacterium]
MLPTAVNILMRITGIIATIMLSILPWFIATGTNDPFINQEWIILSLAAICTCILSVVFIFFRPRKGHFPLTYPLLFTYLALIFSMYYSEFLISLKTTLLWCSILLLMAFMRLSRKTSDNYFTAVLISVSGSAMACYALMQYCGWDFFNWTESPYKVVGTLSNPNYLGAYLLITSTITLGAAIEGVFKRNFNRVILFILFVLQTLPILLNGALSARIGLLVAIFLFSTRFWEIKPGKILRISPFLTGLIVAIVLALLQGIVYYASTTFPWENLTRPPYNYLSLVSRMVVWQMGYLIFLNNPISGIGPGAIAYEMGQYRPDYAGVAGLKGFNDAPHSIIVRLLGETGFVGFLAFVTLCCGLIGIAIWRRSKDYKALKITDEKDEKNASSNLPDFCWMAIFIPALILFLAFAAGFLSLKLFFFTIPALIAFFAIFNSFGKNSITTVKPLIKTPLVALITFFLHSAFNNNLNVPALTTSFILIASIIFTGGLKDLVWKKKFSFVSVLYLCLPITFVFSAYNLESAYQKEQKLLYSGANFQMQQNYEASQKMFEAAIKTNPQSLKAHYGLAKSLQNQKKYDIAQDVYENLNAMVPDVYNCNYEIAKMLLEQKRLLEAHKYALKSLEFRPVPSTYLLLGEILLKEGKNNDAKKIFREGLIYIPDINFGERIAADKLRLNLAALAANESRFTDCTEYLDQIKTRVKKSSDAIYLRGLLLSRKKEFNRALKLFEEALALSPENPRFLNAAGYILTLQGKLEKAQNLLEKAYKILKTSESPLLSDMLMIVHSLGKLYWKQNKNKQAEELLRIAWEKCPPSWESLKNERLNDLINFYKDNNNTEALAKLGKLTGTSSIQLDSESSQIEQQNEKNE